MNLVGRLSTALLHLHVDVNVGDPVWPAPASVSVPRLLGDHITTVGYPLPMVHAEKLVTAMDRGVANTRWRDFADVYLLARRHDIDGSELTMAMENVAAYRGVAVEPLQAALEGYARQTSTDALGPGDREGPS